MCGIVGVIAVRGERPSVSEDEARRMRDLLAARGPDGAGLWSSENVVLGHRRLAVRDLSERGEQPMVSACGRFRLVYNGELYNDAELRAELLAAGGAPFQSACDTETVLRVFEVHGTATFAKLRGMFAIAVYDTLEHRLHLARDPLGIKPLYYHVGSGELTFASDPKAILAHPRIGARPNMAMVSAYLTTLRTVLESETLFEGVRAVCGGEHLTFDATDGRLESNRFHRAAPVSPEAWSVDPEERLRSVLEESVVRHAEADVPVCSLLSGGIDSSILCDIAARSGIATGVQTWCAGSTEDGQEGADFEFAREMSRSISSNHHEVRLKRSAFEAAWPSLVSDLGVPLATPNEVAIHAVCKDLRAAGQVVAISGEGADELFAGYDLIMERALAFLAKPDDRGGGRYLLESGAWMPPSLKAHALRPDVWRAVEGDALLFGTYDEVFARCADEAGEHADPLDPYLRFLRRINLTGLLQRLDTASMATSVEGRTPFADVAVLEAADSMPMALKFGPGEGAANEAGGGTAVAAELRGKLILRRAYRDRLPARVIDRPKESFPLPFERWMADCASVLETSTFAEELFAPGLRREIARNTGAYFQLAWPMINLALWGERWWGAEAPHGDGFSSRP